MCVSARTRTCPHCRHVGPRVVEVPPGPGQEVYNAEFWQECHGRLLDAAGDADVDMEEESTEEEEEAHQQESTAEEEEEEEGGGGAARQRQRPQWSLDVEAFANAGGIVKTRALASGDVGAPSPLQLPSTHTSQCFVFWS